MPRTECPKVGQMAPVYLFSNLFQVNLLGKWVKNTHSSDLIIFFDYFLGFADFSLCHVSVDNNYSCLFFIYYSHDRFSIPK